MLLYNNYYLIILNVRKLGSELPESEFHSRGIMEGLSLDLSLKHLKTLQDIHVCSEFGTDILQFTTLK